eukprot:5851593-Pleurochrysis_carterae.AAC.1
MPGACRAYAEAWAHGLSLGTHAKSIAYALAFVLSTRHMVIQPLERTLLPSGVFTRLESPWSIKRVENSNPFAPASSKCEGVGRCEHEVCAPRLEESECHAAADDHLVHLGEQVLDELDLVAHLGAAQDGEQRLGRAVEHLRERGG